MTDHIGFPLPSEMFNQPHAEKENFKKHQAISKLLDIDLKCPYCEEILEKANDT
jgi:hypothetical protein